MSVGHIIAAGLVSIVAGLLGSLLGLGGGLFVTPMLSGPLGMPVHRAVAASIVAVIATSSAGGSGYLKRGVPNVRLGMLLETGTVIGAIAGTLLGGTLSPRVLSGIFAVVLVYTAFSLLRGSKERTVAADPLAKWLGLGDTYAIGHIRLGLVISVLAGVVSGLLGVGGGIVLVPAMVALMGVPLKIATATSTFMIGITGVASAAIQVQRGNVDPILAAPVILGIFIGASLGPRVAPKITPKMLRIFFLIAIGLSIVEMAQKAIA
ncbi:MAG: permease [Chloroflexi bacterium]|nr:permease [Chloroflexota bacterium]